MNPHFHLLELRGGKRERGAKSGEGYGKGAKFRNLGDKCKGRGTKENAQEVGIGPGVKMLGVRCEQESKLVFISGSDFMYESNQKLKREMKNH